MPNSCDNEYICLHRTTLFILNNINTLKFKKHEINVKEYNAQFDY